jgi:hypothetical protein
LRFEAKEVGDSMEEIRMQRARRTSAQPAPMTDEDMINEGGYEDSWPGRLPSSSRRYLAHADVRAETGRKLADAHFAASQKNGQERHSIPPRRTATQTSIPAVQGNRQRAPYTDDEAPRRTSGPLSPKRRVRFHWLVFVGLAMFIMIIGWLTFSALSSWWQVTQDDWHYGRPRTYQADAVVGHGDSQANPSHFIAINLNRHIVVIEIPGGDSSKAKMYTGPMLIGPGQDLAPVTLTFKDVNGDGKLDMVVNVQGTHFVFLNQNGTFVPSPGQDGS